MHPFRFRRGVYVGFTESHNHFHTIGFGRSNKAVNESGERFGTRNSNKKQNHVNVRRENLALL